MNKPISICLILLGILATCLFFLSLLERENNQVQLTLYCAASFQPAVETIIENFEEETGSKVHVIYNGSGTLLSQMQTRPGDLFFPANDQYTSTARGIGIIKQSFPVTEMKPVIVVSQGHSEIHSLRDLALSDLSISMPDSTCAIGTWMNDYLKLYSFWDSIEDQIIVYKPTVSAVLSDVSLGSADATFAWDAVAKQYRSLKVIEDVNLSAQTQSASLSVLKTTKHHENAEKLANFFQNQESKKILLDNGFSVIN